MTYLLIFTIGPVQSFIASARKTQDLFAGSAILSHLTLKAYCKLCEEVKGLNGDIKLVFPTMDCNKQDDADASNPNRFAVIISSLNEKQLKDILSKEDKTGVKYDIINKEFTEKALNEISTGMATDLKNIARRQLENLPEIYWGAIQIEDDLSNYSDQNEKLEATIGAIKNIRTFTQTDEKGARKCSVDGVNNVVVYRKSTTERGDLEKKLHLVLNDEVKILEPYKEAIWEVAQGEGLSAISYYKRKYYPKPHKYPSTARVALMHLLENKNVQDLAEYKEYELMLSIKEKDDNESPEDTKKRLFIHSDDQLFYEENINDKVLNEAAKTPSGQQEPNIVKKVRKQLETLTTTMKDKLSISEKFTAKYYALLMFDGDKMGEWLSGGKLKDSTKLLKFQNALSKHLAEFAKFAKEKLDKPYGKAVFASGEDFLGFVNLNALLPILRELRLQFDEMVNKKIKEANPDFEVKADANLSFSAGIAIAHYKQPLPTVLDEARRAEKKAKDEGGNRFCISVMRHSGGHTRCTLPFGENLCKYTGAIETLISKISNGEFSNKFIHNLIFEMREWHGADPRELFDAETKRLIIRAGNHSREEKETEENFRKRKKEAIDKVFSAVSLLSLKDQQQAGQKLTKEVLSNALASLRISDFIQRSTNL